jgi:hypothetical protein
VVGPQSAAGYVRGEQLVTSRGSAATASLRPRARPCRITTATVPLYYYAVEPFFPQECMDMRTSETHGRTCPTVRFAEECNAGPGGVVLGFACVFLTRLSVVLGFACVVLS